MPLFETTCVLLILTGGAAAAAQTASPEAEVSALVKKFKAAEMAYDPASLSKLIDDRYVEVSPAGEVDAHDRFLGFYTADKKQPWPPMTVSEEEVRVFGDTAIEVLKEGYTLTGPDGQAHTREVRESFLAKCEGGTWKLIGAQFTGVRPSPSPQPKQ